jgi:hypothetical protein
MASVLGTVRDVPTIVPRTAADTGLCEPERGIDAHSPVPDTRADRPKRQWARVVFVLPGAVAVGVVVATRRDALATSATHLDHLRWAWVPLALGLEWVSISVFARMQRRLLAVGGATVAARPMLATVYAANAIATSLPLAGPELGAAFTYRRFKRQSVETPVAGWTLMVGGVLSPLAGVFVLVAGALLSGNDVVAALGALGGVLGMAAIVLLHTAIRHPRLRHLASRQRRGCSNASGDSCAVRWATPRTRSAYGPNVSLRCAPTPRSGPGRASSPWPTG